MAAQTRRRFLKAMGLTAGSALSQLAGRTNTIRITNSQGTAEKAAKPFARYGCEKMIYDVRMSPQALCYNNVIYIVYQANPDGREAHPHIITYDLAGQSWSRPVQVGRVGRYDHHLAPIVWIDNAGYIHILFNCHIADGGIHIISAERESIESWKRAPDVASSVSYPHAVRIYDDKLLLYYRVFGHMGYWTYKISDDCGGSWPGDSAPLIDFDQSPRRNLDVWAASYHSVCAGKDGRSLHIAFVYKDESNKANPLYQVPLGTSKRYNLYYLRLDIPSGKIYTIEGKRMEMPVTRSLAEQCKVWDTNYHLTNMPSIAVDDEDRPFFLVPVSQQTPWKCRFYFVSRRRGQWTQQAIVETNSIWAGSHLIRAERSRFIAYLVVGDTDGSLLSYGGGQLEEWLSVDAGTSWVLNRKIIPAAGLLYNNPKPVELANGGTMDGFLVFYGWQQPTGIDSAGRVENRSGCYLGGESLLVEQRQMAVN